MHQKHPPAKIAVFVADGAGSAAEPLLAAAKAISAISKVENFDRGGIRIGTAFRISNSDPSDLPIQMLKSAETLAAGDAEIIPADYFAPLDLYAIYGRTGPLEVDLGCGDGSFLVATAEANPNRDFLGIERLVGRVRRVCRKIRRHGLTNARVLRVESSYAVQHLFPPASVEAFHLQFPDPWPKRRHWHRRVVTDDFLGAVHRALVPEGTLRVATDQIDYFREIERLVSLTSRFAPLAEREAGPAISTFEKRFRECDLEIHRLVLRKVSPPRNGVASQ